NRPAHKKADTSLTFVPTPIIPQGFSPDNPRLWSPSMPCYFWLHCALMDPNAPATIYHHPNGVVLRPDHPYSISLACCANSVRKLRKRSSASKFKPPP